MVHAGYMQDPMNLPGDKQHKGGVWVNNKSSPNKHLLSHHPCFQNNFQYVYPFQVA